MTFFRAYGGPKVLQEPDRTAIFAGRRRFERPSNKFGLSWSKGSREVKIFRSLGNPIITPGDVQPSRDDYEVIGVFNAAVARFEDEVVLLLRVAERPAGADPNVAIVPIYDPLAGRIIEKEISRKDPQNDFSDPRFVICSGEKYLSSMSHLRLARSKDGIDFEIEETAAIEATNIYEAFGVEDARITQIDDAYYVYYVGVCSSGVTTLLASTEDFMSFKRHGVMFCPDNKDVVVFPERIGGRFYALHRPVSAEFKKRYEIWISESPDLLCWGNHRILCAPRYDSWDAVKIGGSAPPFEIDGGWLEIYHGVGPDNRYCLGGLLLDRDKPWKILARSDNPIFEPQADYEVNGFVPNVVFTCGVLCEGGKLKIYYGAVDG